MTKLLDRAIEAARELPAEMQDEIAQLMLTFVDGEQDAYIMSPEEEASLKISIEQAARGDFASEDRIQAIWTRFSR